MPLWNSHPTRDVRGHCSNVLWSRTAEQGEGTVVFIDIVDNGDVNDYFECMKMMFDSKVTIYVRVSAMYGFAFGLENRIQQIHNEYRKEFRKDFQLLTIFNPSKLKSRVK